jgi:hypothetical protein
VKNIFVLTFILWNYSALAYNCPTDLTPDQEALRKWLHPWGGVHEIQNCRVEITVCAKGKVEDHSQVVAEIYIVDAKGREAFVPLTLNLSEKIEARANFYPQTMYYLNRDKYFEEESGRTETTRLEMVVHKAGILSLDVGQYATNKRLSGPSASRWFNCGSQ